MLFCFWHGRQMPLIYTHRGEGICVMVSTHRDGQYVANVLEANGFGLVRGSTTRGGLAALRDMVRRLRSGLDGAITPDGPRGPAETMGGGTAQIARLAGVPVVPMGTCGWPRLRFRSWDRFQLPLPLARMAVVEGRPLLAGKDEDPGSMTGRIRAETRRVSCAADLIALPGPRAGGALAGLLGGLAAPAAAAALLVRPPRERAERRGMVARREERPVWMHGSSLGELRGLLPLAGLLRSRGVPVHLTCFTPSARGMIAKSGYSGSFLPLDVPAWIRRFLGRVDPRALVLAETELWPNLLRMTALRGVPGVMVNGRISRRTLRRLGPMRSMLGRVLSGFAAVLVRTPSDLDRFRTLGVRGDHLSVWGDSKALARPAPPEPGWRKRLAPRRPVVVAGSTRPGEELAVARAAASAGLTAVIAPRHLSRLREVEELLAGAGMEAVRWSRLEPGDAALGPVLVDAHGVLGSLYGVADVAFVGGTLADMGGHNVLEPMAHDVPFAVGPSYGSFGREVELARSRGAAAVALGPDALAGALAGLLERQAASGAALGVLEEVEGEMEERFLESMQAASVSL